MRILDRNAKDIIPRRDRVWTIGAVSRRLAEALKAVDRPVPKYLQSLIWSSSAGDQKLAAFAMHCFWTGEYQLGQIEGVTSTEAGWHDNREVTLVKYDPSVLPIASLAKRAAQVRCAETMYTPEGKPIGRLVAGRLDKSYRKASTSDQKRQLTRFPIVASIPAINDTQLTKLNSLLTRDQRMALEWLSPSQKTWLAQNTK